MTQQLTAEFEDEEGERRTLTRQEVLTYTQVLAGAGNETTNGQTVPAGSAMLLLIGAACRDERR